jgi:hypothetical protein
MKKLLVVAIAALVTTSAFAQKSMVRMYGWDSGSRASSFDVSTKSNDADSKTDTTNIAINYAYAITDAFQLGLTYKSYTGEVAGTDVDKTTTGLSAYYNIDGKVNDTCYVALHYNMTAWGEAEGTDAAKDDAQTDIVLEYGHRFAVGSAWGLNLAFSPSVMYTMSTFAPDADGSDDVASTALAWNFLKFDVLF